MGSQRGGTPGSQRPPAHFTTAQPPSKEVSELKHEQKCHFSRQEEKINAVLESISEVKAEIAHHAPRDSDGSASSGAIGWVRKFWAPAPPLHPLKEPPRECTECPELKRQIRALEAKLKSEREASAASKASNEELVGMLTGQASGTADDLQKAQRQWEAARAQNVDLTRRLTAQGAKLETSQKALARAGRKEDAAMDADIQQVLMALNNDIFQFVKSHITLDRIKVEWNVDDGTAELFARHLIATFLFHRYFAPERLPIGNWDSLPGSALHQFENLLKHHGCDEKLIREWRVTTAKTTKCLPPAMEASAHGASRWVWDALSMDMTLSHSEISTATGNLWQICNKAGNLAASFSATSIEYSWEQTAAPMGTEVDPGRHEIIGRHVKGDGTDEEAEEVVLFGVFGGVVRGDKRTGLLADGTTRLSSTQVVVWARL